MWLMSRATQSRPKYELSHDIIVIIAVQESIFTMLEKKLDIASPCRGICKIDEPTQLCEGCLRTIDEITRWRQMDNDQKLAVLTDCLGRQQIPSNSGNSESVDNIAAGVPGKASDGCP